MYFILFFVVRGGRQTPLSAFRPPHPLAAIFGRRIGPKNFPLGDVVISFYSDAAVHPTTPSYPGDRTIVGHA